MAVDPVRRIHSMNSEGSVVGYGNSQYLLDASRRVLRLRATSGILEPPQEHDIQERNILRKEVKLRCRLGRGEP